MSELIEIRLAAFPECWETCGTCASEDLEVAEIQVAPGDRVELYDILLVLEAVKTEMEITATRSGRVEALLVDVGDRVDPSEPLVLLAADPCGPNLCLP